MKNCIEKMKAPTEELILKCWREKGRKHSKLTFYICNEDEQKSFPVNQETRDLNFLLSSGWKIRDVSKGESSNVIVYHLNR